MKRVFLFIILSFFISVSNAQTWKKLYDNSKKYWEKDWKKCAEILEKALPLAKKNYETQDKDTTYTLTLNGLAMCYVGLANYSKVELLLKESKETAEETFGNQHLMYAISCQNLGLLYKKTNHYDLAESLLRESKEILAKTLGTQNQSYEQCCDNLISIYKDIGKDSLIEPLLKEIKDIRAKMLGTLHLGYASSCTDLGMLYYKTKKYTLAESLYKETKEIVAKTLGTQQPDYAYSCGNLGNLYQDMKQYGLAEPLLKEAKEVIGKTLGIQSNQYAISCSSLGSLYEEMGQYLLAEPLLKEAREIKAKTLGTQHLGYASSCGSLGGLYQEMSQYTLAEPLLKEAKEICAKTLGIMHPEYATSCNNLGLLYQNIGRYTSAESLYKEAKEIKVKILGTQHPDYATSCNNLGNLYEKMGQHNLAEPLLKEAKEIYAKTLGVIHPDYATSCDNLGVFYKETGQYVLAERLYIETKDIRAKMLGTTHPSYALSCNNLGVLYDNMGQYGLVESLYKEAKEVFIKTLGNQHPNYIGCCSNLGFFYQDRGWYNLAEPLLKEARNIYAKILGTQHIDYAASCNGLGVLYQDMGQYLLAESLYIEAKDIYKKILGTQSSHYVTVCNNLGVLYYEMGQCNLAEPLLKEAKVINEKTLGAQHSDYATSCNNLGALYEKMGQYSLAEPLYKESNNITLTNLQQNFSFLTEAQKENYVKINQQYFQNLYKFTLKTNRSQGDSYNIVLATKGLIAGNTQSIRNRILSSGDSTLKNTYLKWQYVNKKIAQASDVPIAERVKKGLNLDSLQKIASEYEKTLNVRSEEFKQLGEEAALRYNDIQKKLSEQEACIEMVRVTTSKDSCMYMALVLTRSGVPQMIPLDTLGVELESSYLANYRRSIKNKLEDVDSYLAYWSSITAFIAKNNLKKVYFSPDGVYNQININTLYNPKTKKYVLDELEVINVTNTKEIALKRPNTEIKNAFLVGNPDFKAKTHLQNIERSVTLTDLKGTEVEVNNIEQTAQHTHLTTQKITAQAATKDTILHQVSPSILHIATHGFFKPNTALATQRMLQSGLILAGAEILSAFEAMQMDLRGTELVCLSACETGLGEIKAGEGVYGLQRAFRVAGAKAVIMSLWKVNDEATQELMSNFYTNWLEKKQSKRVAFNNAQNTLRKKYQNPYYWGAFVIVGE